MFEKSYENEGSKRGRYVRTVRFGSQSSLPTPTETQLEDINRENCKFSHCGFIRENIETYIQVSSISVYMF